MKATGYVLKSRDYIGSAEPPATVLEDESGRGNNGAFKGAGEPDWVRRPSGLWVSRFDGTDDEIVVPDAPSLDITKAITLEAWVKADTLPLDGVLGSYEIFRKSSAYMLGWYSDGGTINYLRLHCWGPGAIATWNTSNFSTGVWHHIVGTYDRVNGKLYVDGVERDSNADDTAISTSANDLGIGSDGVSGGEFDGDMVMHRIRNYALSAEVIAARFQSKKHWFGV